MSAYATSINLKGVANWFMVQAKEENDHAIGFYRYLLERNEKVELLAIDKPTQDFKNLLAMFVMTLAHEKLVTKMIHDLYELAVKYKDFALMSFLKWYIDEQVEEEGNALELVEIVRRVQDNDGALFIFDKDLATRKYIETSPFGAN